MAGNTKALRSRIKSVSSTLQLTRAMELVASSKIRRANLAMLCARQYEKALESALFPLLCDEDVRKSPYFQEHPDGEDVIFVIAGDRGLAGGYNANVFRLAATLENARFIPLGKRACDHFGTAPASSEYFTAEQASDLAKTILAEYRAGKIRRFGILFTQYKSVIMQKATLSWILPLQAETSDAASPSVIFEPNAEAVLAAAVLTYLTGRITCAVRESFASEVTARRMAMDSAGKNAKEMIDSLNLAYNRARQGAITQEITEIVAGSGAE